MSGYPEDETRVGPAYQQPMPYQQPYGYDGPFQQYGYGYGPPPWKMRMRRQYPIETKPFFMTSEFVGAVAAIAGIAITAAASDAFGAWRAWILITAVTVGYMVSRGIAKSGTRSHADDPREHFSPNWSRSGAGAGARGSDRGRSGEPEDGDDEQRPFFG